MATATPRRSVASKSTTTAARRPRPKKVTAPAAAKSNGKASSASPGMSDAAVKRGTGKTWEQWFSLLDADGAAAKSHSEIASLLAERHGVAPWWSQMVTVGYERARGLREKHQVADGYSVSGSRTIAAPIGKSFRAWTDESVRERWLPGEAITIRKATKDKSARITWSDGKSSVEVNFYGAGEGRCKVTVQQGKLTSAAAAKKMKAFWGERLDVLKGMLEGK